METNPCTSAEIMGPYAAVKVVAEALREAAEQKLESSGADTGIVRVHHEEGFIGVGVIVAFEHDGEIREAYMFMSPSTWEVSHVDDEGA